jgi:hypothetical protein
MEVINYCLLAIYNGVMETQSLSFFMIASIAFFHIASRTMYTTLVHYPEAKSAKFYSIKAVLTSKNIIELVCFFQKSPRFCLRDQLAKL